MQIDKNTQAAFYFYSEMVKDSRGLSPRGADAEWFVSLTEAERQAEIQRHIDSVNEMTEFLEAERKADVKFLEIMG
jgi:hypothetical protein